MNEGSRQQDYVARSYRYSYLIGYLSYGVVAIRNLTNHAGSTTFGVALALLALFLFLYATHPWLSRRFSGYNPVYFLLQGLTIQSLGLLQPYDDTWVLLYITVGFQVMNYSTRRVALAWGIVYVASMLITLTVAFGWASSLGRSLIFLTGAIFVLSYDYLHTQSEVARQMSQGLLAELQAAHQKLQEYAESAQELAAAQERARLRRELHDSVGQILFSITLNAQATRMLLVKDPQRVPGQLERLQELTNLALRQMRALISEWRTG